MILDSKLRHDDVLYILGKKSIAQSAKASIINGQRLHISREIVGEKKVIYDTISKTSSKTSAQKYRRNISRTHTHTNLGKKGYNERKDTSNQRL